MANKMSDLIFRSVLYFYLLFKEEVFKVLLGVNKMRKAVCRSLTPSF